MKIKVNDKEYQVRPMDEGRIALAGFQAMHSGETVSIPLTDGTVIENVRSSDIEAITRQITAGQKAEAGQG